MPGCCPLMAGYWGAKWRGAKEKWSRLSRRIRRQPNEDGTGDGSGDGTSAAPGDDPAPGGSGGGQAGNPEEGSGIESEDRRKKKKKDKKSQSTDEQPLRRSFDSQTPGARHPGNGTSKDDPGDEDGPSRTTVENVSEISAEPSNPDTSLSSTHNTDTGGGDHGTENPNPAPSGGEGSSTHHSMHARFPSNPVRAQDSAGGAAQLPGSGAVPPVTGHTASTSTPKNTTSPILGKAKAGLPKTEVSWKERPKGQGSTLMESGPSKPQTSGGEYSREISGKSGCKTFPGHKNVGYRADGTLPAGYDTSQRAASSGGTGTLASGAPAAPGAPGAPGASSATGAPSGAESSSTSQEQGAQESQQGDEGGEGDEEYQVDDEEQDPQEPEESVYEGRGTH